MPLQGGGAEGRGAAAAARGRQLRCRTADMSRCCEGVGSGRVELGCDGEFNENDLRLHAVVAVPC